MVDVRQLFYIENILTVYMQFEDGVCGVRNFSRRHRVMVFCPDEKTIHLCFRHVHDVHHDGYQYDDVSLSCHLNLTVQLNVMVM